MKLVVGLGNPGDNYSETYHNIGFDALEVLAARFSAPSFTKKNNALISDADIFGKSVILCEPTTYMNLSGDAVLYISRYFKIDPSDILVIYDDIDLHKGTVRARPSGSSGTHNGMRDIIQKLGSDRFARVRIGTGLKPDYMELKDYVLSRVIQAEKPIMKAACEAACDLVETWIKGEPWQNQTVTVC